MRINYLTDPYAKNYAIRNKLWSYLDDFCKEYDLGTSFRKKIAKDDYLLQLYCDYLTNENILNISLYKLQSGHTVYAAGWEIKEDELLTEWLLKAELQ